MFPVRVFLHVFGLILQLLSCVCDIQLLQILTDEIIVRTFSVAGEYNPQQRVICCKKTLTHVATGCYLYLACLFMSLQVSRLPAATTRFPGLSSVRYVSHLHSAI